ncbi:hypothetical protein [Streptobacillus moniliformis]|uniref:Major facilitator superfamily (MFS) profile domain-containing protein n=1 Tax=Streptobacillus moniliformis (strain ATCC 14647 / DSM 12112 / NCTC 10651 / 9901) TaxID=519441 RepID=D1AW77_STRM9|nr:hypothetical protein [Streptobacillus moniliformis]ACZ00553.1 hypothetical protein Smon_0056 [Streptobacillus moniliformis DSM 12112]AVL43029.1 hypothetical protein CEP89_03965 [Streptobacillus moniliformis]SQA14328.1 Uncharacterised protein [Streptobacillus moniliformis]
MQAFSILGIILSTYTHPNLIKNDESRATIVSVLNTFSGLIMTILLSLNGILSTRFGILNSWRIFILLSIIAVLIVSMWEEPKYD